MAEEDGPRQPGGALLPIEAPGLQEQDSGQNTGIIRLRGLPFHAGDADVRAFFGQFELTQVFICKRNGRSNGEAFVQLLDHSLTQVALEKLNRQHIGPRYIELFQATASDLSTAQALTVDRLRGYVIRMRGLPYTASAADVLRFLDGVEVVRGMEGVIFTWTPDGRPTGEAFVDLKDEAAQAEAMKKHKELMGTRYIELFTSTKGALMQAIQHNRLILGHTNRRRWIQQAGVPAQPVLTQPANLQPVISQQMARINDVTEGFSGMSMHAAGVVGRNILPIMRSSQGISPTRASTGLLMSTQSGMGHGAVVSVQDIHSRAGIPISGQLTTQQPDPGHSSQALSQQMSPYISSQPISAQHSATHTLIQQPQVIESQGYGGLQMAGSSSLVVPQPYVIQKAGSNQYFTVNKAGVYGSTSLQALGGGHLSEGLPGRQQLQGQYVVGQNYPLRAIQLPVGTNIHQYLQLSSTAAELQPGSTSSSNVGGPTAYVHTVSVAGLGPHVQAPDGSHHALQ